MRKGFTIIELLVASLLLGMLVTILTMIFNQSSIAWRTGQAGVVGMNKVRENIAEAREEADNVFIWKDQLYRTTGLWKENGQFRNRACSAPDQTDVNENKPEFLRNKITFSLTNPKPEDFSVFTVGSGSASGTKTYTVNVMSAGPDREFDTWDDVWSWPDDFE